MRALVCLLAVLAVTGCSRQPGAPPKSQKTEEPPNWRAESYFDDEKAIAICDAIAAGDLAVATKLLDEDEAVAATIGQKGMTPLLWAIVFNSPDAVEALLEAGADPRVFLEDDVGARPQGVFKGFAPIHVAAGKEDPIYLTLLLEHGADANLKEKWSAYTPVYEVLNRVDPIDEHLQLLVDHGADLNFDYGLLPTVHAVRWLGRFDYALKLLKAGANPFAESAGGARLVHSLVGKTVSSRKRDRQQEKDYQELIAWLEDHGEPVARIRAQLAELENEKAERKRKQGIGR